MSEQEEALALMRAEINTLFDAVVWERKISEVYIFQSSGITEPLPALGRFVRDVATCPVEVLAHCRSLLAIGRGAPKI